MSNPQTQSDPIAEFIGLPREQQLSTLQQLSPEKQNALLSKVKEYRSRQKETKPLPSQQDMDAAFMKRMKALPPSNKPVPTWEGSDRNIMDFRPIVGALPVVGMTVGSLIGGGLAGPPGAVAGSAAGGALGEYGREKIEGEPASLGKIAGSGAIGAGSEFGGQIIGKGVEKVAGAISPKAIEASNKIIARLIKPTSKGATRVAGSATRLESDKAIAGAVNNVAGDARSLNELHSKVTNAIEDTTAATNRLVGQYAPQWKEAQISATGTPSSVSSAMVPRTALATGKEAPPAYAASQPGAKMYTKSGGVPIYRMVRKWMNDSIDQLDESMVADKSKVMSRLATMIFKKAGNTEITPADALELRRWIRRDLQWPAGTQKVRDKLYRDLNSQIESFLDAEDAAKFRENNAAVHRLLKAQDAIDNRLHSKYISPSGVGRYWLPATIGAAGGGAVGGILGGPKGAAAGASMGATAGGLAELGILIASTERGQLSRAAAMRAISGFKGLSLASKEAIHRAISAGNFEAARKIVEHLSNKPVAAALQTQ